MNPVAGEADSSPPVTHCVWCGEVLDDRCVRLAGRARCPARGAETTDPWPTDAELDRAYGEWYRPASGRRFSLIGDMLLRRSRGAQAARIDEVAPPGPILDVGAGDGTLVDALKQRGRDATGLQRGSTRPDFREQSLDEVEPGWAGVVLWHSLEHLPEPGAAIGEIARVLEPGGVAVIAVPNSASLRARVLGDRWLHFDLPRHVVQIPSRALTSRLEKFGFRGRTCLLCTGSSDRLRLARRACRRASGRPPPLSGAEET